MEEVKPEALRIADALQNAEPNFYGESSLRFDDKLSDLAGDAMDELRRLHAECESLRTQLAAAQTLAADRLAQMTADRAQALRWRDEAERNRRSLEAAHFTDCGGKLWKPPIPAEAAALVGLLRESQAEAEALRKAAGQASFCLRELLPNDPDAQMTVRMIDTAMKEGE